MGNDRLLNAIENGAGVKAGGIDPPTGITY
jgi:hypothetical protein